MPFKSKRQIAWGAEQVTLGKWTRAQFEEWMKDTPKDLPERVEQQKPRLKIRKTKVIK